MNKVPSLLLLAFTLLAAGHPTFAAGEAVPPALPKVNASAPSGGPSDATIKYLIQNWLDTSGRSSDGNSFTRISSWDSEIRRGKKSKHRYYGIGEKIVYPVKIDFTALQVHQTRMEATHWKGGLYDFYQDDFGEWAFSLDGGAQTSHEQSIDR